MSAARAEVVFDFQSAKKEALAAQDEAALAQVLDRYEADFSRNHCLDAYAEFLRSLERKDAPGKALLNYKIGWARFAQLKFLEENQRWEEYFNQGAALRTEALDNLADAYKTASAGSIAKVYAAMLLWQYHKDQQDSEQEASMQVLSAAAGDYAAAAKDPVPLKTAADLVSSYGEKVKAREIYALYFRKFSSADMSDEKLFTMSSDFLSGGNIDLAETGFDLYLERIHGYAKEQAVPALLQIGRALAYQDKRPNDPAYAERMFAAAEAAGGADSFDEDTLYLRAFNLEQGQEMLKAGEVYADLAERYADGKYQAEAVFKAGVIAAYVRGDITAARGYFERLAAKEPADQSAFAAMYQLGLFKQWEQDNFGARELYTKVTEKAGEDAAEIKAMAKKRLEEIAASKPIDFALQTFLDNSLGQDGSRLSMTKAQIFAPALAAKGGEINVSSEAFSEPSGCTQVTLTQYWSGNTGTAAMGNGQPQPGFTTSYKEPGIKVLNLMVMSPSGAVDRAIKMVVVK